MTTQENGRQSMNRPMNPSWGPIIVLLTIGTVVFLVLNQPQSDAANGRVLTTDSRFDDAAFLSGVERRYGSVPFRGGEADAFMGGVKLDFRDAIMEGDSAVIDVAAVMGGVEIRIPKDWTVINHVTSIMGGVKDHTNSRDTSKRLVIEGTVLMGGLEIKN